MTTIICKICTFPNDIKEARCEKCNAGLPTILRCDTCTYSNHNATPGMKCYVCSGTLVLHEVKMPKKMTKNVEPNVLMLTRLCHRIYKKTGNKTYGELILKIDKDMVFGRLPEQAKESWHLKSGAFDDFVKRIANEADIDVANNTSPEIIKKIQNFFKL